MPSKLRSHAENIWLCQTEISKRIAICFLDFDNSVVLASAFIEWEIAMRALRAVCTVGLFCAMHSTLLAVEVMWYEEVKEHKEEARRGGGENSWRDYFHKPGFAIYDFSLEVIKVRGGGSWWGSQLTAAGWEKTVGQYLWGVDFPYQKVMERSWAKEPHPEIVNLGDGLMVRGVTSYQPIGGNSGNVKYRLHICYIPKHEVRNLPQRNAHRFALMGIRQSNQDCQTDKAAIAANLRSLGHEVFEYKYAPVSRIKNAWEADQNGRRGDGYLNVENGSLQSTPIQSGWLSALWRLEKVDGVRGNVYRIRNVWKPRQCIHIQTGGLMASEVLPGWHSSYWILENVKGSRAKRLRNFWKREQCIHMQNGPLGVGPVQDGWQSAQWHIQEVDS
jgi:hypothetical protein